MAYKRSYARRRLGGIRSRKSIRSFARTVIRKAKRAKLVRFVKKIAATKAEWKMVTRAGVGPLNFNNTITDTDFYELMPFIQQGTKDMQRVGDTIAPGRYLKVRCRVVYGPASGSYPVDPTIFHVRIFILSFRQGYNHFTGAPASWSQVLLKQNDGQSLSDNVAYDGTYNTSLLPVNKEIFKVHYDKVIKLTIGGFDAGTNDNSPNPNFERWFNFRIKLPKRLIYENADNSCVNFNPFVSLGFTAHQPYVDYGSAIRATFYPMMWYKDM